MSEMVHKLGATTDSGEMLVVTWRHGLVAVPPEHVSQCHEAAELVVSYGSAECIKDEFLRRVVQTARAIQNHEAVVLVQAAPTH